MTTKTVHRFEARTVADASRKARQVLGEDVVVVAVNLHTNKYIPGTDEPMVEVSVIQTDKIGIPSLLEYYQDTSTTDLDAQDLDSFPARYRILWDQLLRVGMRSDQAAILCREAWLGDPEFRHQPWHRILTILEENMPCNDTFDYSEPLVIGLVGERSCGRTTVARQMCEQAGRAVPGRVALVSEASPEDADERGYSTVGMLTPPRLARALKDLDDPLLTVVDLPVATAGRLAFHLIPWANALRNLQLVPVVTAADPAAGVTLIRALKEFDTMGFVMTYVNGPEQLGVVVNLAMATNGPLGIMGGAEGQDPKYETAIWRKFVRRMMNHTAHVKVPTDGERGQEDG